MCPCEKEQEQKASKSKKKYHHDILAEEIDSWSKFEYALREKNRLLFHNMLEECKENKDLIRAANSKDEFFSAESLFMALILQQQKTIKELIAKISEQKKRLREVNEMDE